MNLIPYNPMDLSGRVVLVTGASSGIGRETAILLSRLGARVAVSGRDGARLAETLGLLEGTGHQSFPFDLADSEKIVDWVKTVATSMGPLYGLAHSAGLHGVLAVRAASAQRIETVMRTNLYSAMLLVRGFCQKGCRSGEGSIVFLSSVAALAGSPALSLYAASKAALLGMTKSLAAELARDQIRINCVTPGMVKSELTDRFEEQLLPDQFEAVARRHLLGIGTARDVAAAIAFLLADTGRWITGTSLIVDGGYTAV